MGCASSAPARLVAEDALTPHGDGKAFSDARSAEPDAGSFAAEPKDCGPNAIAKLADHPQDLALDIAGETPGLQEAHHATSTSFTRCECDGRAGDHDKLSPLSSSPHRKEQQSSSPGAHRVASTATTALGDSDSGELEASFVIDTMTLETRKNDDGVKFINEFEVLHVLGKGAFGKVKKVRDGAGEHYAMKIMDKTVLKKKRQGMQTMLDSVMREIAIMKVLDHRNCVRLHEVINDPAESKLFLRLEFAAGGACMPAENGADPIPIDTARRYWSDLIHGVEFLHSMRIAHRDIKPENLLLDAGGTLKLADYGVSETWAADKDDMVTKSAGTPAFMDPAAISGNGPFSARAADLWAAAVTLYFFVHGRCPFIEPNVVRLFAAIQEQPIAFDEGLPPPLFALLRALLEKEPAHRPTLQAVKEHEWFLAREAEAM